MSALAARRPWLPMIPFLLFLSIPAWSSADEADPVLDELVNRIIALRGEVDDLDSRLQGIRKEHRDRMSSLAREEGTLVSERERQQLRLRKIEQDLAREREALAVAGAGNDELKPVLRDAIAGLRDYVESGLPFKRGERLDALSEMEGQLESDSLPPPRVANRLWAFVSDEIRLATETGLYRQTIRAEGRDRLADVARLGMMHLYFRTEDNRVGYARRDGDDWQYIHADGNDRGRIDNFMSSLRQQIRSGYFELPNPRNIPESN